jgi:hypothetical protein
MRILELENRCTGNRTVGSNPTLSAKSSFIYNWCRVFRAPYQQSHLPLKALRPGHHAAILAKVYTGTTRLWSQLRSLWLSPPVTP